MPNKRSAGKETLSFYVPRTLGKKLRQLAKARGETLTAVVTQILNVAVTDIKLSVEERAEVQAAIRAAQYKG